MAMKQTQTKLFDFSDVGLDFCAGSKNLFPDRFKKILAEGFNFKTVSTVSVVGNQITLNYGVIHGYSFGRILKIDTGELATINNGEFYIESVTETTVTLTVDDAPVVVSGGFETKVAPLGWELVYENLNIHVYKFKALDDTDLFARFCFQDVPSRRNCISPCVGKSFDIETGFITDEFAYTPNKDILSPGDGFKWDFTYEAHSNFNNYSYAQGLATFGKGSIVGSLYHFGIFTHNGYDAPRVNTILPAHCFDYAQLKLPVITGELYGNIGGGGYFYQHTYGYATIGNTRVVFFGESNYVDNLFLAPYTSQRESYISSSLDSFNTTTVEPLNIYEHSSHQFIGVAYGMYRPRYNSSNRPGLLKSVLPMVVQDSASEIEVLIHATGWNSGGSCGYVALPIEEIKIV